MTHPYDISRPSQLGAPAVTKHGGFVQTERAAHEAWTRLTMRSQPAAAVLHTLVARMGSQNAVVMSQATLAEIIGVNLRTVSRAVRLLVDEKWIQTVRIGAAGSVNAYVVNDTVAWGQARDQRARLSVFSAMVVASETEQPAETLEHRALRKIPLIYAGEQQIPTGIGEDPPSQPGLEGVDAPDLPALRADGV